MANKTVQKEIEQMFGFVPPFFEESLPEHAHDVEWGVFKNFQMGETALPNKTKELIGLAIAAHIKCKYCIYFHTEAARAFGASEEELKEACFMGGHTVQFSNALSGMQIDFERFKDDVDRGIAHLLEKQPGMSSPQH
jgi:AhpD family alkylhydroperoxidase